MLPFWQWTLGVDGWILAISLLCACACALPGAFLVVRRTSMMADAVSHAVLPGIALGFLLSGTRNPMWMLAGAAAAGLVVALGSGALARVARMDRGAALGICFTAMFSLGLLLIVRVADRVDLDPSCVLYGAVELAPLDTVEIPLGSMPSFEVPRAALVLGAVALVNALVGLALWKQLKVSSFDEGMAHALGMKPKLMEAIILAMAAATCVAAFESVGSVLVVAMMIVPAAVARLMSQRLSGVIGVSIAVSAVATLLGHWMATGPALLVIEGSRGASTAGSVAAALGGIFVVATLIAPQRGVVVRIAHRWLLSLRIAREDALGLLWRLEEDRRQVSCSQACALLRQASGARAWLVQLTMSWLQRIGSVTRADGRYMLTESGRREGAALVRSHRLWETYLMDRVALASDHVHPTAMALEHITDAGMRERLALEESGGVGGPRREDPHGRVIPEDPTPRS